MSSGHIYRSRSLPSGSGPHCVRVATGTPITLLVGTARRSASGCSEPRKTVNAVGNAISIACKQALHALLTRLSHSPIKGASDPFCLLQRRSPKS